MKKLLLVISVCFFMPVAKGQSQVGITFVANEGFLLNDGSHKILIDAIFTEGNGQFTTPPAEMLIRERNAESPFDAIDFLLSTHYHADHINPTFELEHLSNDTLTRWIGPPQVYDLLESETGFSDTQNRLYALLPVTGETIDTLINDFHFRTVRLVHYNNPENNIQNLGYIFTLASINIFHPGDGYMNDTTEITNLDLADNNIDLLFLSYRVLNNDFENLGRSIIKYLHPKAIILMHIPINQSDYYQGIIDGLLDIPPVYIMEEQMSKLTLTRNGDELDIEGSLCVSDKEKSIRTFICPNPTNANVTVYLPETKRPTNTLVELLDLYGNKLDSRYLTPCTSRISINLGRYPKGIYLLYIRRGQETESHTICLE
jgi:L-ascorbate metabolism protein UlaG (beta-lactamase superfamily)